MANKSLVIVESPSKAKTIGKFLGSKYKVVASVGHIRDLPKSKLGINIENNFDPEYIPIKGKGSIIKEMKKEAKGADRVLLATDLDREGEAISWHIAYLLGLDETQPCRIVFNEITKDAIKAAVKNPRPIDQKLVDAQQARRVLDRLVGYKISPLLWKKVRRGLSAGRVQSAALKIICDREKQIKAFVPKEYWTIDAMLHPKKGKTLIKAKLSKYKGKDIEINNEKQAQEILDSLDKEGFQVVKVEKKERKRNPNPPFTTSSLQQEASTKLGFSTRQTMLIAQNLYEGIDIKGHGTVGLVTYIRTDSVRVSAEAEEMATAFIKENYDDSYLGKNVYKNKRKDVQDAHEAIRPSNVNLKPEDVKESLSKDQYNLYKIIWERFIASRMHPAVYDAVEVTILNNDYTFKANGSKLKFEGYLKVYDNRDTEEKMLPAVEEGDNLKLNELIKDQHFTQPPPRFTEASLVKDMEEKNIGRPSTYAPIIATIMDREYVIKEKKALVPTDLGFIVTELMEDYFKEIVDTGFTADLEDRLDDIEVKNIDWKDIIKDFYGTLAEELEVAENSIEKVKFEDEVTDELCEKCGKNMVIKSGRYGKFLACSGYPDCKTTKPIVSKIDVPCPVCGKDIVARKGKKGKLFYGCSGYPDCTQIFWNKPLNEKCPKCGSLLTEKKTKTSEVACSNSECDYKR